MGVGPRARGELPHGVCEEGRSPDRPPWPLAAIRLRGVSLRLCAAATPARCRLAVRHGGASVDPEAARRSFENRSARCARVGAVERGRLSRAAPDPRTGAGSVAQSGSRPHGPQVAHSEAVPTHPAFSATS